jgi:acyl-CoA thioesterase-1
MLPKIVGPAGDHLVVIGDSISAGLNQNISWPVAFEQTRRIPIRNLARVGATAADAASMAKDVSKNDNLLLIEIGGNDMIVGTPPTEFSKSLEGMLAKLSSPKRTIVMMELPLLPYRVGYGQAQRRLSGKYGVWLVPKRYFVRVLAGADATSDGLHLTTSGARAMADLVARVFAPVLNTGPAGP